MNVNNNRADIGFRGKINSNLCKNINVPINTKISGASDLILESITHGSSYNRYKNGTSVRTPYHFSNYMEDCTYANFSKKSNPGMLEEVKIADGHQPINANILKHITEEITKKAEYLLNKL